MQASGWDSEEVGMVVIQKRAERTTYTFAALAFIPDILLSLAAAIYTDSGIAGFLMVLVGLQCVYLAIWIKNSLWYWFMYWVAVRRRSARAIEDYLIQNRFPPPPKYVGGTDEYLSQIMNDRNMDCEMRIKAATEIGSFAGMAMAQRHQMGMQLRFAFEEALERYARRVGRRRLGNDADEDY
jgi:hypothetical protein